jgi:tRNA A-37 threonylcarbamoyl transferase component Bud32
MVPAHPPDRELDDFLLGRLVDADHARVEVHVADCETCQSAAAGRNTGDTFTDLLAAARENRASANAATPLSAFAPTLEVGGKVPPAIPPGLANHPRYRLLRPLGSGGMGTVWLAEHLVLGRSVAVKVIRPEFLARPEAAERFRREARAVAQLAHPNIVAAYDAEEAGGTHFLAMEYVPGENLMEGVRTAGPLPVAEACRAARDAARALAAAHTAGLIHRDVKPHNLIRTPDGSTKVLDFGLATAAVGSADLTGPDAIVGTPDYIAPEQAEDPRAADARSDIYALGCTLYHLLAGRPPFADGTILHKLDAHRADTPASIHGLRAGLAAVLAKMTAKRPADRYPTAAAVADALEPFCEPERAASVNVRQPRRQWLIAIGILFGAFVLAAGIVVIVRDKDGKEVGRLTAADGVRVEVVSTADGAGTPPAIPAERVLTGHVQRARQTVFSGDGKTVYSCGDDGFARAWDVSTGRQTAAFDHGVRVLSLTLARNGNILLTVTDTALHSWDVSTSKEIDRFPHVPERERLNQVAMRPDGTRAATVAIDGTIRVWDVPGVALLRTWKVDDPGPVYGVAWSPDGKRLATAGEALCVWDAESGKRVGRAVFPSGQTGVAFTADGKWIVAGGWEGLVRICDPETGRADRAIDIRQRWQGSAKPAVTADGRLVIGGFGDAVTVWNLATGALLFRLTGHEQQTNAPAISADGKYAAAGSDDKSVCIWRLPELPGPAKTP